MRKSLVFLVIYVVVASSVLPALGTQDGSGPSAEESRNGGSAQYKAFPTVVFGPTVVDFYYPNASRDGYRDVTNTTLTSTYMNFGDLNGDGLLDQIRSIRNGDSTILWGSDFDEWSTTGTTSLKTSGAYGSGTGDFNGDGAVDLVFASLGTYTEVFLNDGSGDFPYNPSIKLTGAPAYDLNTGDLNNDGYCDIVTRTGKVFFGGPSGPDNTIDINLPPSDSQRVEVIDIDEDGHLDVIFSVTGNNAVDIYMGNATGPDAVVDHSFGVAKAMTTDVGDVNGDSYNDIVITSKSPSKLIVVNGSSSGWNFQTRFEMSLGGEHAPMRVCDVNLDGIDDILVGNEDKFEVYYGGSEWPPVRDIVKSGILNPWDLWVAEPTGPVINATLPERPQNLSASGGDRTITLAWQPPDDTGGFRLLGYTLYRGTSPDDLMIFRKLGWNVLGHVDAPPEVGRPYYYAVSALNIKGESNRSDVVNMTCFGTPTAPIDLSISTGCNTLHLVWNAPEDTGGLPILGYRLFRGDYLIDIPHYLDLGVVEEFRDTRLENGQVYYYRLCAFNEGGNGTLTDPVQAFPIGPPTEPRYLILNARDGQIELEWRGPAYDGGSSILGYHVFRGTSADTLEMLTTLEYIHTSYIDGGLTNGVTYHYAIQTFNEIGDSPFTSVVNGTPVGLPGIPIDYMVEAGDGQVILSWEPPEVNGGTEILRYEVIRGTTNTTLGSIGVTDADVNTYADGGLLNGMRFYYAIYAVNKVGNGPWTEVISAMPLALPDAPGDLVTEAGDGEVIITWLRPQDNGGAEVTQYVIYRGTSAASLQYAYTVAKSRFTYVDEDVLVGTTYHYAVATVTAAGEGPRSIVASAVPYGPPSKPLDLVATSGDGEVRLTWSAPEDDGASAIIGYVVMRGDTPASISELAQLATVTSYLDTSVTNGVTYHYAVAAINEAGPGDNTDTVSATPLRLDTEPGRVLGLVGETNSAKVTLQWSAPTDDGGSPVTGYVVMRGESWDDLQVVATLGVVTSWTDEDAQRGRTYYYSVCAVNDVGPGEPCATFEVKVPKKAEESPGFETLVAISCLLVLVPIFKKRRG